MKNQIKSPFLFVFGIILSILIFSTPAEASTDWIPTDSYQSPQAKVRVTGTDSFLRVYPCDEYTNLFKTRRGWIGGDAVYTVRYSREHFLWLFGDTLVGSVTGNRRDKDFHFINNTVAFSKFGTKYPFIRFYMGKNPKGRPEAVIKPDDGRGWFWLYDGIRTNGGTYVFLIRIEKDKSVFGFKATGMSLGKIDKMTLKPEEWKISQKEIPHCSFSSKGDRFFGSAVMKENGYVYLYGIREKKEKGLLEKFMIVSRVKSEEIEDFDKWEFFNGKKWQPDFMKAADLAGQFANEYSVSYQPFLKKFITVYTENGNSRKIMMRTADKPEGPWSEAFQVYDCPEADWSKNTLVYAAKGHEILSGEDELVVSYVTNSMNPDDLTKDQRYYRPLFIKIKFYKKGEQK